MCVCVVWLTAETRPSDHCPSSDLGLELSLPCATSSLWAAVADFTRALVALAMFFAASRICSSKFRESSAPYACVCVFACECVEDTRIILPISTYRADSPNLNPNPKAHTTLGRGFSSASFLAAASMDAAACRSSVSAMTFGSLTSTQSPAVAIAMK